ncbi:EpsG family protein [Citrobacter sedlakii]|uniref:EpsG family protein n=1 Tax=Citrobacter sedlakii TaxID=67826 RepID=UPI0022B33F4F|nr:EpsG family protein [Citrobacter sedlakii]MCZ4673874.1 EpsG family protein [Citrobacter sedlakii]MDR5003930.1 EpsG family protein [Citrobacter sedlakii]
MFLYALIFIMIMLLSFLPYQKTIFKVVIFVLFFICAFRGEQVDRDHSNYISLIFDSASNLLYPIEPSFKVISWLSINIFGTYQIVFIIFALIAIYFKSKAIEHNSPYILLSALVLYSNIFLLHDMTQIRAGVACAIVLYALKFLGQDRRLTYILFVLMASTFHITSILFLCAILFDSRRLSMKYIFIYILMLSSTYLLYYSSINFLSLMQYVNIPYIQFKYNEYISQSQGIDFTPINIFSTMQILHLFIVAISFIVARRITLTREQMVVVKLYSISPLAFMLLYSLPVFALRISELFSVSEIILLPTLVLVSRQKALAKLFVVGICLCMFYINIYHLEILKDYSFS